MAAAKGAQVAIGFEDGAGDPQHAVIGRRGTASWTLQVKGTPAHSSQIFRERHRLRRGVRGGADPQRVPREAGRAGAPDVQPGGRPRRHAGRLRRGAVARHRRSARTTSSPSRRSSPATCARCRRSSSPTRSKAMTAIVAESLPHTQRGDHVRRRLPAAGADRRQPPAAGAVRPGEPRPRRGPGDRRQSRPRRRRRRVVRRGRGADDPRRHRDARRRRTHRQRDRRSRHAARRRSAAPPCCSTD